MTDCFNSSCPFRDNWSSNPYKCECVACPNRTTESHIIMSNRTLVQGSLPAVRRWLKEMPRKEDFYEAD